MNFVAYNMRSHLVIGVAPTLSGVIGTLKLDKASRAGIVFFLLLAFAACARETQPPAQPPPQVPAQGSSLPPATAPPPEAPPQAPVSPAVPAPSPEAPAQVPPVSPAAPTPSPEAFPQVPAPSPAPIQTPTEVPARKVVFMAGFKPQANLPFVAAYVAQEKGYFREQNLDVEIRHASSGEHLKLLMAGDVDFTTADSASVLKRRSDPGLPIVAFALFGQRGQQAFVALQDSGIDSPSDWEGQDLWVQNVGTAGL